jgi:hypothetical protein
MTVSGQPLAPLRFTPKGGNFQYPLNRRLGGPQRRSERFGEALNLFYPAGIRTLVRTVCSLVTTLTPLSQLIFGSTKHILMKSDVGIYAEI